MSVADNNQDPRKRRVRTVVLSLNAVLVLFIVVMSIRFLWKVYNHSGGDKAVAYATALALVSVAGILAGLSYLIVQRKGWAVVVSGVLDAFLVGLGVLSIVYMQKVVEDSRNVRDGELNQRAGAPLMPSPAADEDKDDAKKDEEGNEDGDEGK